MVYSQHIHLKYKWLFTREKAKTTKDYIRLPIQKKTVTICLVPRALTLIQPAKQTSMS